MKRDDTRRSWFKRIKEAPTASGQGDETIKQENPKGQLNELCQRNQLSYPAKRLLKKEDGLYYCRLNQVIAGKILETMTHCAAVKITAEQLAAQEMLELLTAHLEAAASNQATPAPGEAEAEASSAQVNAIEENAAASQPRLPQTQRIAD